MYIQNLIYEIFLNIYNICFLFNGGDNQEKHDGKFDRKINNAFCQVIV